MKKVAFCIGNGQSRKGYDLQRLRDIGPLYGCGAVWRDNHVDNLICCDKFRAQDAIQHHAHTRSNFYTRADWIPFLKTANSMSRDHETEGIYKLPTLPFFGFESHDQPISWNSGLYAVATAIHEEADVVMMLGYDFYGSGKNQRYINNVYKNSKHYRSEKQGPGNPAKWIAQFQKLFAHYYKLTFIFIKPEEYPHPQEFDSWRYVLFDTYEGLDKFVDKKLDDINS